MDREPGRNAGGEAAAGDAESLDFIRAIIKADLESGRHQRVHTRFPPEPNGYLHIGHAKSICLNFGIAREFGGLCNLRFDDTNPETEEVEYVESIKEDVRWLGFDWDDREYYASDYFEQLYEWARHLVREGKAYICSLSEEEVRRTRGTVTEPGKPSPDRARPAAESLDLLERMRRGEVPEGVYTLRAKINMAHPNMKMRDPLLYRIKRVPHHRTGDAWNIYPMYDFAHGQSDAIEGITHSICTLEFEVNRPLYDWFIENLPVPHRPHQYEFARLNLSYTIMSKRLLLQLVQEKRVGGWDDPRMPTICGLRRRGYTPEAIRAFCDRVGVAKRDNLINIALLEYCLREDLNRRAGRRMAVLDPLKVVIENHPAGKVEWIEAVNNPEDEGMGTRRIPFSREIWIERDDFREDPPKKFFRLKPGGEVRLKHACYITCTGLEKNDAGEIVELRCVYDPESMGGTTPDRRKVQGTLHWVSAAHARDAEVRLYDHLFTVPDPAADERDFRELLNPDSLKVLRGCKVEPSLADAAPGTSFQFLRQGYFCVDRRASTPAAPVFNRTVTLKDTWAKIEKKNEVGT